MLIVGLDGATMELIAPWVEQGRLPNLGRMMKNGVWADLRSTKPYITTTAWSSFATGLNPGKHGIFDFYQHIPKTFDVYFTNSGVRRGKTLWRRLSDNGKKVCVVNVPMTYPPEKVNGILISGMDAPGPESQFTYPADLYRELKDALGEYIIDIHFDAVLGNGKPELHHFAAYLERLSEMIDNRCKAAEYLMSKYPWDLFVTVFVATDRIQHQFWKFMDRTHPAYKREEAEQLGDAILTIYRKCDEALGRLLDRIDDNTSVLIMSDHGAGPGHRVFYVRTWLQSEGYLLLKGGRQAERSLQKNLVSLRRFIFATGKRLIPRGIKQGLKRRIGRDKYIGLRLYHDVDWENTRAYSEGVCGNIFINLKGREPYGIVEPGNEYANLCAEISERLLSIRDPKTSNKVVTKVYRKEELYSGPFLEYAPDLTVEGYPEYHCRGDSFSKELSISPDIQFTDAPMSGTHRLNGAFLGIGPRFKKGYRLPDAAIVDIAPTVLYLLGMDIPETMDGKVLVDALDENYVGGRPVKKVKEGEESEQISGEDVYSAREKEQIEERLKGLGYLE